MLPFHRWLRQRPLSEVLALALAGSLLVSLLNWVVGPAGPLWALQLLPVGVATWYAGRTWGVIVGIVAGLTAMLPILPSQSFPLLEFPPQAEVLLGLALMVALALFLEALKRAIERPDEPSLRLDASTGLLNTRALFGLVAGEVERAQRYERAFTLLYLSVDNLPVIRQQRGSAGAEDTLRRVAHHLKGSLRTVDVVARLRDREFAVLLPETEVEAARIVIGRVQRTLLAATAEDPEGISIAIGATTWRRSGLNVDALHQRTYQLLYAAQRDETTVHHEVLDGSQVDLVVHRHLTLRR